MYKFVRFTRAELFDKVWSSPLLAAAKEIGVSDVALGKACRKAGIPLPGRGYWLSTPKKRRRMPLPPTVGDLDGEIEFRVFASDETGFSLPPNVPSEVVAVAETLIKPHPLVARTRRLMRKSVSDKGWVSLDCKEALNLKVTSKAFNRALRIMDALIKDSEAKGFVWRVTTDGKTVVEIDGQSVEVVLVEKLARQEQVEPARRRLGVGSSSFYVRNDLVPTGLLSFRIDQYVREARRKNWNDTARRRLDDQLHEIVSELPTIAVAIRHREEEHAAQKRRWEEEERQRKAAAWEAERLRRLRLSMVVQLRSWERANRLRAFVADVERRGRLMTEQHADLDAWLSWANNEIERLDPVNASYDAILSLEVSVPEYFASPYAFGKQPVDWWNPKTEDGVE